MNTILSFSLIIWIIIVRFKKAWEACKYSSYITSLVALGIGLTVSFFYRLDLIVSLGLAETESAIGYIFTGFAIMGGSSCVAEIMEMIAGPHSPSVNIYQVTDTQEEVVEDESDS